MSTHKQQQLSVLSLSTLAFTVCFAVWATETRRKSEKS